jgi:hypothetical protein
LIANRVVLAILKLAEMYGKVLSALRECVMWNYIFVLQRKHKTVLLFSSFFFRNIFNIFSNIYWIPTEKSKLFNFSNSLSWTTGFIDFPRKKGFEFPHENCLKSINLLLHVLRYNWLFQKKSAYVEICSIELYESYPKWSMNRQEKLLEIGHN